MAFYGAKTVSLWAALLSITYPLCAGEPVEKTVKIDSETQLSKQHIEGIASRITDALGQAILNDTSRARNDYLYQVLKKLGVDPVQSAVSSIEKNPDWSVVWDARNGTPVSISNNSRPPLSKRALPFSGFSTALSILDSARAFFRLKNPSEEFRLAEEFTDNTGQRHVRMAQYYRGIPLWNQEVTFHFGSGGNLLSVNSRYSPTPAGLNTESKIDSLAAQSTATDDLFKGKKDSLRQDEISAGKYIWTDNAGTVHLVWNVRIKRGLFEHWIYFIDSHDGKILMKYNSSVTGQAHKAWGEDLTGTMRQIDVYFQDTSYCLIDASRPMWISSQDDILGNPHGAVWTVDYQQTPYGGISFRNIISIDNNWNDPVAISAHRHVGMGFEYFYNTFNRLSLDGAGGTIRAIVHLTGSNGLPYDNAGWSSSGFMVFGDGYSHKPFAGGLDIVVHEMSHGVVQYTVNLEYVFQAGALNESYADFFAAMADRDDWLIGEDVSRNSAFRDMQKPSSFGQPDHMDDYRNYTLDYDNGGVHINSGIPNRAGYLLASSIGRDKTEKIYYRVLEARYLNRQSQFTDMRLAALRSADDLFGRNSFEYASVKKAFDEVGIIDTNDPPQINGREYIAAVKLNDAKRIYLIDPNPEGVSPAALSGISAYSISGKPISVPDSRQLLFVDNKNCIRGLDFKSGTERIISNDGVWSSVAMSSDGSRLAATTKWADSSIYIFDLVNNSNSKVYHLYNPHEGAIRNSVIYADVLDWEKGGRFLAFDCKNKTVKGTDTVQYWSILFLDIETGEIFPVFPKPAPGVNYMNPSLSRTGLTMMVFDYADIENGIMEIRTSDYGRKVTGRIESTGKELSFPKFSSYDSSVLFTAWVNGDNSLRKIRLDSGRLNPSGQSIEIARGFIHPNWFVSDNVENYGSSVVSRTGKNGISSFSVSRLKDGASIEYGLSGRSRVDLHIISLDGRMVASLYSGFKDQGRHSMVWTRRAEKKTIANGLYYCRLTVKEVRKNYSEVRPILIH